MSFSNSEIVAIVAAVIAFVSLLWAVYTHLTTKRTSKLFYEVSDLSRFNIPNEFISELPHAPFALEVLSVGNKSAENVAIRIETKYPIIKMVSIPKNIFRKEGDTEISCAIPKLNPTEEVKLFGFCNGSPSDPQIYNISITHAEGKAVDKNSKESAEITFGLFGLDFQYNLLTSSFKLLRFGPISFGR